MKTTSKPLSEKEIEEIFDIPARSNKQNRAMHLLFRLLADDLNEKGLDQRKVLKPSIDIPWTPEAFKEMIWRPVQKALFQKESTTEVTTAEINLIVDTLNRHFSQAFGVGIKFPSINQKFLDDLIKQHAQKRSTRRTGTGSSSRVAGNEGA